MAPYLIGLAERISNFLDYCGTHTNLYTSKNHDFEVFSIKKKK